MKFASGLTYTEFFNCFMAQFREFHPNSSAPKNNIISMFYEDYLKGLPVPSY